jgi:hypothetical protein
MTTWVMDRVRLAFSFSTLLYIGDVLLNLLIAATGIALFMIGMRFLGLIIRT